MIHGCKLLGFSFAFLALTTTASAYPKVVFPPPKDGRIDNLVPVMAQAARCAALSDPHGLLAFGHDHTYGDAHVTLFRLDAKGNPPVYGTPIKLPRPEGGLAKNPSYVTGLAFHPKLPLLYVWQDNTVFYTNPPTKVPAELNNFDHLLIYNVAGEVPALLMGLCRGPDFIYGQQGGGVAVDDSGSFVYVPNLREKKNAGSLRLGRFPLDADGLPLLPADDKDFKSPLPIRAKRLVALNAANPLLPPQMTPIEYEYLFNNHGNLGCGMSFHPVGKDAVIASLYQGFVTWRPDDKEATVSGLHVQYPGKTMLTSHPTLPVLYATAYQGNGNKDSFYRVEHIDGNLTLLPRQYIIPDTNLTGPPAVLGKSNQLAIGGHYQIYLVSLDDRGMPTGAVTQTCVLAPAVQAMVYSARFDRLFVGVEISK